MSANRWRIVRPVTGNVRAREQRTKKSFQRNHSGRLGALGKKQFQAFRDRLESIWGTVRFGSLMTELCSANKSSPFDACLPGRRSTASSPANDHYNDQKVPKQRRFKHSEVWTGFRPVQLVWWPDPGCSPIEKQQQWIRWIPPMTPAWCQGIGPQLEQNILRRANKALFYGLVRSIQWRIYAFFLLLGSAKAGFQAIRSSCWIDLDFLNFYWPTRLIQQHQEPPKLFNSIGP